MESLMLVRHKDGSMVRVYAQPGAIQAPDPADCHWHVQLNPDDDDVFVGDLLEALEYAAGGLENLAEFEHDGISAAGEMRDFEGAYRTWERSELYACLAANARNLYCQHMAGPGERAPLYRANDDKARAALWGAVVRWVGEVNSGGPRGFGVWECALAGCAPDPGE